MDVRPLRTESDYDWMLAEIERRLDDEPEAGTPEGDRLEVMLTLLAAYEAKQSPIEPSDPVEVIKFMMEQNGRSQSDFARLIGSASRASEVLNRRRRLTMEMVYKLNAEWHIPADALIRPYELGNSVIAA